MMTNTDGRRLLVKCLEDVYALESHLVQTLGNHAKDAQDFPQFRQKIEQHQRETELHRDRIEQRLNALGGSKPGFKAAVTNVVGQALSAAAGSHVNTLVKNACEEYASEHLEMASYVELITVAQSLGDMETVRTAQLNLRDETSMQQWLIQHLPEVTLQALQREGVPVPSNAQLATQNVLSDVGLGGFGGQQPYGQPSQPPYQQGPTPQTPPVVS
jgi:ferritin-like metal-binding protein YciE